MTWFKRKHDQRQELHQMLQQLRIDWLQFRERALRTLDLLALHVPCEQFRRRPSPESLLSSMEETLQEDRQAAIELRELVTLASLESAIDSVREDAASSGLGYLQVKIQLPLTVLKLLGPASTVGESQRPKEQWIASYLSAYAGLDTVAQLDEAINAVALAIGAELEGLSPRHGGADGQTCG